MKRKRNMKKVFTIMIAFLICFNIININVFALEETQTTNIEFNDTDYKEGAAYEWWMGALIPNEVVPSPSRSDSDKVLNNGYVELWASDGSFTLEVCEDNPILGNVNYKAIILSKNYTTIRIDGVNNQYISNNGVFDESQKTYTSSNTYNGVHVIQELKLVDNQATGREDVLQIKYTAYNTSDKPVNIGARIMLDIRPKDDQTRPFKLLGYAPLFMETEFVGDDIPQFWQTYDVLRYSQVMTQGRFICEGYEPPSRVQFTNFENVAYKLWGYSVDGTQRLKDCAISSIWDPDTLEPQEQKCFVTYCGLSEWESDLERPLAAAVYADSTINYDKTDSSIIDVIGCIENIQRFDKADVNNISASIILPEDFVLSEECEKTQNIKCLYYEEEFPLHWKVQLNTDSPKSKYIIKVIINADECEEKTLERTIHINVQQNKKAILVVPGIMGSNLVDSNKPDEYIWIGKGMPNAPASLWEIMWRKLDCNADGTSKNKNIIPLSGENEYGAISIYEALITELRGRYESEGYDVFFVPYDWRMKLDDGAERIKKQIENYDEVIIVAHSMGGLVTEKYITDYGNDKITKVITAGTPYWGAPMALETLYTGRVTAFPDLVRYALEDVMQSILVNFTGLYKLLPNEQFTNAGSWFSRETNQYQHFWDYIFPNYVTADYNWDDTSSFYKLWFNRNLVETALKDHNEIYTSDTYSPMDTVDCTMIVGTGVPTAVGTHVVFTSAFTEIVNMALSVTSSEGDGTVPFVSATMNRIFYADLNADSIQKIDNFVILDGIDHVGLVNSEAGINQIVNILDSTLGIESAVAFSGRAFLSDNIDANPKEDEDLYKMLLAADCKIEITTSDNECAYYQIGSSVLPLKDVRFDYCGTFGRLPIVMTTMQKDTYSVTITSKTEQNMQFAISVGNKIYGLENYQMSEGDIFSFDIGENGNCIFAKNGEIIQPVLIVDGEIVDEETVDGEGRDDGIIQEPDNSGSSTAEITADDISVESMNANSNLQYSNTINPRIRLTNKSDKKIELKDISFEYIFNGDGWEEHRYESDWEALDHQYIGKISSGAFYVNEEGDDVLKITFPESDIILEPNAELEIHCRMHTKNWDVYDMTNDISLGGDSYEENGRIRVYYNDIWIQ